MNVHLKCCFCLEKVVNPVVMCQQTHIGCFDCVCTHLNQENALCALCRGPYILRFDRLLTELTSQKKRKRTEKHAVFLQILELKRKNKYRTFTRSLRHFAQASNENLAQISEDVNNIKKARSSAKRLKESQVFDAHLYASI